MLQNDVQSSSSLSPEEDLSLAKLHLKWFNGAKGFGFLMPEDESYDAFLHITTLQQAGLHSIGEGAVLMCKVFKGDKGRQVREVVEVIDKGAISTIPEMDEETGTVSMGVGGGTSFTPRVSVRQAMGDVPPWKLPRTNCQSQQERGALVRKLHPNLSGAGRAIASPSGRSHYVSELPAGDRGEKQWVAEVD